MSVATVAPLPDGRYHVESQGQHVVFHEEEEAVEEARRTVRTAGGGLVELLAPDGTVRDRIHVPAPVGARAPAAHAPRPDAPSGQSPPPLPGRDPRQQAGGAGRPQPSGWKLPNPSETPHSVDDALRAGADKAVKSGLSEWWSKRTTTEQVATALIAFALALGPLGLGVLAAFGALFKNEIPSSKQVEALVWLFWIALPLAAFIIVVVWLPGKHASLPVALIAASAASVGAAYLTFKTQAPQQLAGVYCYAEARNGTIAYEKACRTFNNAGFIADNARRVGNPSSSPKVYSSAVAYTADARGSVMAFAAILAALGVGLILRERA